MESALQLTRNRQIELRQLVRDTKEKYKTVLLNHINLEDAQKRRRDKVEMQLLAVLAKYDEYVGRKSEEYDEICERQVFSLIRRRTVNVFRLQP